METITAKRLSVESLKGFCEGVENWLNGTSGIDWMYQLKSLLGHIGALDNDIAALTSALKLGNDALEQALKREDEKDATIQDVTAQLYNWCSVVSRIVNRIGQLPDSPMPQRRPSQVATIRDMAAIMDRPWSMQNEVEALLPIPHVDDPRCQCGRYKEGVLPDSERWDGLQSKASKDN